MLEKLLVFVGTQHNMALTKTESDPMKIKMK